MARVKVKLADNLTRVVFIETDATIGARLGTNLYMPSGDLATKANLRAYLGITDAGQGQQHHRLLLGLPLGNDHPQYPLKAANETITGSWLFDNLQTFQNDGAVALHVRNETRGGASGFEFSTAVSGTPGDGVDVQMAMWEDDLRLYGFRFDLEGMVPASGDLVVYRHNNDAGGAEVFRIARDASQIRAVDGTLAQPFYSFGSDTDLGIYRAGTDNLGIGAVTVTQQALATGGAVANLIYNTAATGTAGFSVGTSAGVTAVRLGYSNTTNRPFINVTPVTDMTFQQNGTVMWEFLNVGHWQARDNIELRLGTGGDFQAWHDGTNTVFDNDTGNLSIRSGGSEVIRITQTNPRVQALAGTAALPTFSWFGDTNNGMYYIGTDNFGFSAGGTLRMDLNTTRFLVNLPIQATNATTAINVASITPRILIDDTDAATNRRLTEISAARGIVCLSDAGAYSSAGDILAWTRVANAVDTITIGGVSNTLTRFNSVANSFYTSSVSPNPYISFNNTGLEVFGGAVLAVRGGTGTDSIEMLCDESSGESYFYTYGSPIVLGANFSVYIQPAGGISLIGDNEELQLGAGTDLRLYHNGTNSVVENDTGNLILRVGGELALEEVTTTTSAPAAGGAGALPATPAGYMTVVIAGVTRQMPYY
jgi:hypothetical protein